MYEKDSAGKLFFKKKKNPPSRQQATAYLEGVNAANCRII